MNKIPLLNKFTCSPKQLEGFVKHLKHKNILPIIDYINENKDDHSKNFEKMNDLILDYPNNYIALKLSSLNIENDFNNALDSSLILTEHAINNNSKILIDSENYLIQDKIEEIANKLLKEFNQTDINVYKTYQMYRVDSFETFKQDLIMERDYLLGIKLVRGAYYNEDYKYNILYDDIEDTHKNYNKAIQCFTDNSNTLDKLMIATHNKDSIKYAEMLINKHNLNKQQFEFAQLLGLADNLTQSLVNKEFKVFKYLPFGEFHDSIPYLLRRLNENKLILTNLFY